MRKLLNAATLSLIASLFLRFQSLALTIEQPGQWVRYTDAGEIISNLVALILIISALAFFIMLVIGGVQWIVSGGDKAGTEQARGRITAALIGLIIVFSAWAITKLLETFFGITILGGEIQIPGPGVPDNGSPVDK